MKIFLAGGVTGNLNPVWRKIAQTKMTREDIKREVQRFGGVFDENIFSGRSTVERWGGYDKIIAESKPYILESFYYANADTERLLPLFGDFLLDSGAFTFMSNAKQSKVNWDEYIRKYADFIKRNRIKKYFELDIDNIVGYEKVKEYRKRLEDLTGEKCIPVWHKSRGKEEFLKMCDEYDYVAIGGIVTKEITKDQYPFFTWFINEAHKRGCKIHGLGFTSLDGILKYKFDTVDSTAWTTGNRFGYIYKFNGKTMTKIDVPRGKRLNGRLAAINNFSEWIRFQQYADKNL